MGNLHLLDAVPTLNDLLNELLNMPLDKLITGLIKGVVTIILDMFRHPFDFLSILLWIVVIIKVVSGIKEANKEFYKELDEEAIKRGETYTYSFWEGVQWHKKEGNTSTEQYHNKSEPVSTRVNTDWYTEQSTAQEKQAPTEHKASSVNPEENLEKIEKLHNEFFKDSKASDHSAYMPK